MSKMRLEKVLLMLTLVMIMLIEVDTLPQSRASYTLKRKIRSIVDNRYFKNENAVLQIPCTTSGTNITDKELITPGVFPLVFYCVTSFYPVIRYDAFENTGLSKCATSGAKDAYSYWTPISLLLNLIGNVKEGHFERQKRGTRCCNPCRQGCTCCYA